MRCGGGARPGAARAAARLSVAFRSARITACQAEAWVRSVLAQLVCMECIEAQTCSIASLAAAVAAGRAAAAARGDPQQQLQQHQGHAVMRHPKPHLGPRCFWLPHPAGAPSSHALRALHTPRVCGRAHYVQVHTVWPARCATAV